ncbi:MAG TPA: Nif3-like dinuclear metal center hexameric protein [Blastocatellia bacterium]|nr:Nif3-like dinuclear metal center hexameric protein [Blastocatellia bacterium]HMV85189.1 Nif3-like dinuclear metal center hexameric protein [Blastocatellia bacterium]HMX24798.1 Nif3-like dinuclear metal center hexameric protein [Blastocatellia bacterium]HMY73519.1 Nif3-like dinuclear metal center hexameric protein [Blastocatellia bacterium]HMZ18444.1 Nif3-like dinuclear metal center hexameric protein [Blastocatellia bacterium]
MKTEHPSRRSFLLASVGIAATWSAQAQSAPALTAGQVIDRIKANVGIPWRAQTVDNIIAGSADTPVKGIATTMMATLDVVKRAAAAGKNMVITHESTFFSHQDRVDQFLKDETYLHKLDFLNKNNMVVFHFHDHLHGLKPMDGVAKGMMRELGWEKYNDPQNFRQYNFPGIPLAKLAKELETKLKIRTMRVVGDPNLTIKRAMASWGNCSLMPGVPFISQSGVDVLIIGETHEWELVEYVQDMISSGRKKALIVLGHVVSEQSGMKFCADWLKGFVTEVPIEFIAASEPFWRPDKPIAK